MGIGPITICPIKSGHATFLDLSPYGNVVKVVTPISQIQVIDIPKILEKIAECESGGIHFDNNGQVIKGKINPLDTGKYQINLKYWGDEARQLGYNLFTFEGNTLMALWIYEHYGTKPWSWSKDCWSK